MDIAYLDPYAFRIAYEQPKKSAQLGFLPLYELNPQAGTKQSAAQGLQIMLTLGRYPKGPRTQIIGLLGPNTIMLMVFGP